MPLGTAPNDIFQNGKWYNRQGVEIGSQLSIGGNIPVGLAPSGTMAANGAVTLGTALGKSYPGGIWLYYPAGAVFSGSAAGLYWTVLTTTTTGTVFTNTLAAGSTPTTPSPLVAVSDAGPGAFTAGTTTISNLIGFTVPGGVMGPNGQLHLNLEFSYNNAAGTKTITTTFGGSTFHSLPRTTAGGHDSLTGRIRNVGVENRNTFYSLSESTVSSAPGANNLTVDTTQPQQFLISLLSDTATNWIVFESVQIETFYAS